MDHIPDLSAFQGVMLSADNRYSFAKLKSRAGNEEKIKYIVEKAFDFLKEKNYITENGVVKEKCGEYEKLALYLVLNADLPALEDMTELPVVGALVWTLPTLPAPLLGELLAGLHMQEAARRAVALAEPRLALQLGAALAGELRHADPRRVERPALLARALHRLLCRLPLARAPPPRAAPAAAAALRACLQHLAAAPRRPLPADDRHTLLARALAAALRLAEDCFARFAAVQRLDDDDFADIYRATHPPDGLGTDPLRYKICDCPDREISESLRACNSFLLDECAALAMSVSVDAFCAWSEHEEGGRSLQRAVGELCHRVAAGLRGAPGVGEHALLAVLAPLARAPVAPEDVIADADPATIAARVGARDAEAAAWLAALLRRPDLCRHAALLRLLDAEADVLDEAQGALLFDRIVRHLRAEPGGVTDAQLKTLAIKAFQRCGDSARDEILADQFREHLHDDLETAGFEAAAVETFNRLTGAGGAGPDDALAVFLQNPLRTLERVCGAAGGGAAPARLMLRVVARLGPCAARRYPRDRLPALLRAAAAALDAAAPGQEARAERLARFLEELARHGLLPRAALLRGLALPRLQAALGAGDARALGGAARLLRAAAAPPAPPPAPRAALLAALAQALDAARAPPAALHPAAPAALDRLLALLVDMLDAYCDHISDAELRWLRGRLQRSAPLTRCHFARLWGPAAPRAPPALPALVRAHPADALLLAPREWELVLGRGARGPGALAAARAALRGAARAARARRGPAPRACLLRAHAAAPRALQNVYLSCCPSAGRARAATELALALAGREPELAALWAPLLARLAARAPLRPALLARLAAAAAAPAGGEGALGARYLLAHVAALPAPAAAAALAPCPACARHCDTDRSVLEM